MSDEAEPTGHDDAHPPSQSGDALLRHEELSAKVREANKQSLTGPDSPTLHLYRE